MRLISCVLFLSLAACGADATKTDGSATKSSASSSAAKPAGSTAAADTSKATSDAPAQGAAPPADALDDSGKVEASCDTNKESGGCTEHYNLGMGAESAQKMCEADGMKGKWTKGQGCPKEGRVAVCRTEVDRMIYYKNTFAPGNTVKDVGKLCTETLSGKFAEFPKGK